VIDAGDVVTTRDLVLAFLTPLAKRDWAAPIPDLEWDCETTLRHMIRAQSIYAAHLATRAKQRLPLSREVDPGLGIDALLDNLRAQVSVLAAVIRDAPPEARSWHNSGMTDPSGYSGWRAIGPTVRPPPLRRERPSRAHLRHRRQRDPAPASSDDH